MQDDKISVAAPGVKILTAWGAVGITSWSDAAAAIAFLYTFALFGEWVWKRILRPVAEDRGWVKRKARRADDADC